MNRLCQITVGIIFLCIWQLPSCAQPQENQPTDANQLPLVNQLGASLSPYLAIHGDDPVAWQGWSPATLELARQQNKLLFVSIGYFSCHWCHVMQAESYRNAEIAALINQNFIPVKVDRELAVALDAEMIAFAQSTLGSAGWPLNVFITPEGYPLYATLYEKPDRFGVILNLLAKEWRADSTGLKAVAQKAVKAEPPKIQIKPTADLAFKYRQQLVRETLENADFFTGGLNAPRKFPLSPQLAVLLEIEARNHNARLSEWLRLTLDQMAGGGLHDHLAGGFFRYTVDPHWQRPHFEKMLYDNAQLAMIYLRAARVFKSSAYHEVAIQTLDFMLNEMRVDGAFITSISALNDKGTEGGSYLWSEEQLKAILDPDELTLVTRIWGLDIAPEFDFGYLPMNRNEPTLDENKRLKEIYPKLLQERRQRRSPADTKLLAGLNGIALEAFSAAAALDPRYRQAADALRTFLVDRLWQNGVLQKGISRQQLLGQGDLESYAYAASGLIHYAELGGKSRDTLIARQLANLAWQKFYTPLGFLLEQESGLARPFYQSVIADGPMPSPSSVLIDVSLRTGSKTLHDQAMRALADGDTLKRQGLFWFSSQVNALSRLHSNTKP
jgi:uncharacterized protein YyaL (SSP411 family)